MATCREPQAIKDGMTLGLAGGDHDEAPPQTPAARSFAQAATPWTGHKVSRKSGTRLRDFTPKENKTHKQCCQLGKQQYWGLIRHFAMRGHVPQKVTRKVEVLANLPWLALNHDDEQGGA